MVEKDTCASRPQGYDSSLRGISFPKALNKELSSEKAQQSVEGGKKEVEKQEEEEEEEGEHPRLDEDASDDFDEIEVADTLDWLSPGVFIPPTDDETDDEAEKMKKEKEEQIKKNEIAREKLEKKEQDSAESNSNEDLGYRDLSTFSWRQAMFDKL